MFCPQCGKQLQPSSHLCSICGTATPPADWQSQPAGHMLRPLTHRMIGGVCAAFALRYGWTLGRTRIITVVLTILTGGWGAVAYIAAWVLIPQECYPLSTTSI